jgi:hypothetical protein
MTIPLPSLSETLGPITEALDTAEHADRLNWMRGLSRKELRALYTKAEGHLALETAHFHTDEGAVVIHHGQNSLPAFNAFQKRVCRRGEVLQGYNHQTMAWFTGPGHFTLSQDGDVPAEFPTLKPNEAGFSRFVYGGMVDRVRRVSAHCVIGAAFKGEKAMGAWFMLTREG